MINNTILEKLRKVLTLANAAGTQGEAEAALARAKEIALRYSIDLASVELTDPDRARTGPDIVEDTGLRTSTTVQKPYHRYVYSLLERVCDVKVLISSVPMYNGMRRRVTRIWVIGDALDVAMATALFPWLEGLFPRLFNQAVRVGEVRDRKAASENGFFLGLYHGILSANERVKEQVRRENAEVYAIVLRDKESALAAHMAENHSDVKSSKARQLKLDGEAYTRGQERGRQVNLRQVGSTAGANQIS